MDYALQVAFDESSTADHHFTLTLFDASGQALGPALNLPAQRNTETLRRQRFVTEVFAEVDAASITIELDTAVSPAVGVSTAEVYDAWIEFQPAQQRGTI